MKVVSTTSASRRVSGAGKAKNPASVRLGGGSVRQAGDVAARPEPHSAPPIGVLPPAWLATRFPCALTLVGERGVATLGIQSPGPVVRHCVVPEIEEASITGRPVSPPAVSGRSSPPTLSTSRALVRNHLTQRCSFRVPLRLAEFIAATAADQRVWLSRCRQRLHCPI